MLEDLSDTDARAVGRIMARHGASMKDALSLHFGFGQRRPEVLTTRSKEAVWGHKRAAEDTGFASAPRKLVAGSKERKRIKRLRAEVARAERIKREGLPTDEVGCPDCGAAARSAVRHGEGSECRAAGGRRVSNRTGHHKARTQRAKEEVSRILEAGRLAAHELAKGGAT